MGSPFKDLVYLYERQSSGDRAHENEREIICPLAQLPGGHNGWGWAMPKAGAEEPLGLLCACYVQALEPSLAAFAGTPAGTWIGGIAVET